MTPRKKDLRNKTDRNLGELIDLDGDYNLDGDYRETRENLRSFLWAHPKEAAQ